MGPPARQNSGLVGRNGLRCDWMCDAHDVLAFWQPIKKPSTDPKMSRMGGLDDGEEPDIDCVGIRLLGIFHPATRGAARLRTLV